MIVLKQRVRDSMVHILYSRLCRKAERDWVKSRGLGHLTQSSRLWVTGTVPNSATTGLGLNRTEKYYFLGHTVCTQQMKGALQSDSHLFILQIRRLCSWCRGDGSVGKVFVAQAGGHYQQESWAWYCVPLITASGKQRWE